MQNSGCYSPDRDVYRSDRDSLYAGPDARLREEAREYSCSAKCFRFEHFCCRCGEQHWVQLGITYVDCFGDSLDLWLDGGWRSGGCST